MALSTDDQLQGLLDRPGETLNVELKPWLKPSENYARVILVRALLALRNQNGGYLIIGIGDDGSPLPLPAHIVPTVDYHADEIQAIVSKYASKPFSIAVHFRPRNGQEHPIIQVESGIKTPVACKADLKHSETHKLTIHDIYVRTLSSNGIVSSANAHGNDLEDLVERCFQNREAGHAKFLARVLQGLSKNDSLRLLSLIQNLSTSDGPEAGNASVKILNEGSARFLVVAAERGVDISEIGFLECALTLEGRLKGHTADDEFLQSIKSVNPGLTGWPIWLVSSTFREQSDRPYTNNDAWEEFIDTRTHNRRHLDFMIFRPTGEFYFRRMLEDDGREDPNQNGKILDPILQILRVAEALVVGQSFGSFLRESGSEIKLKFEFRWSGLKGRFLTSWSHPERDVWGSSAAYQDEVTAFAEIGILANEHHISKCTHELISSLTRAFGGYKLPFEVVSDLVFKLLFRRL